MSTFEKGKASREVVQNLIDNMSEFSEVVREELGKILSRANDLSNSWKDPQYDQFNAFICELVDSLIKDINIFDEEKVALQKKLQLYS